MPKIYPEGIKQKALELRKQGYTYSEIPKLLNYTIPKSNFTGWFKNVVLSDQAKRRVLSKIKGSGEVGRMTSWKNARQRRANLMGDIYKSVDSEIKDVNNLIAKISLAMLYLGEGGKTGELFRFGNSDPKVVSLFLRLLRQSFSIEENRLRGHVQCRADQNIKGLEQYWSDITSIPLIQLSKSVIDKRTIGIPTKKPHYKGVFVVEYYSKALFFEVKFISDIICKRLNLGL